MKGVKICQTSETRMAIIEEIRAGGGPQEHQERAEGQRTKRRAPEPRQIDGRMTDVHPAAEEQVRDRNQKAAEQMMNG